MFDVLIHLKEILIFEDIDIDIDKILYQIEFYISNRANRETQVGV